MTIGRVLALLIAIGFAVGGCEAGRPDGESPEPGPYLPDAGEGPVAVPPAIGPGGPSGSEPILLEEPAILYIQASPSEIEQVRARTAPEDFFTIADDFMFYRSEAFSVIERASVPLVTRVGRVPVRFMADGEERTLDLSEVPWLDLIVLFDPGRDPLLLAPIDLSADTAVVSQYFRGILPSPGGP